MNGGLWRPVGYTYNRGKRYDVYTRNGRYVYGNLTRVPATQLVRPVARASGSNRYLYRNQHDRFHVKPMR